MLQDCWFTWQIGCKGLPSKCGVWAARSPVKQFRNYPELEPPGALAGAHYITAAPPCHPEAAPRHRIPHRNTDRSIQHNLQPVIRRLHEIRQIFAKTIVLNLVPHVGHIPAARAEPLHHRHRIIHTEMSAVREGTRDTVFCEICRNRVSVWLNK